MIVTYKHRHNMDYSDELRKARQVAKFAVKNRTFSSKDVKHIGLKSMISNQILRKYGRDKKCETVKRVNLVVPNQGIKVDRELHEIYVPCLKLRFQYRFPDNFEKVNQIEVNSQFVFVSVTVIEVPLREPTSWIGIDLNATGHVAVAGDPSTGKTLKLGKRAGHTHKKYKNIRRNAQKKGKYGIVKQVKHRESNIVRDINHKISRKIVDEASESNSGIKLEDLTGIRENKNKKSRRSRKPRKSGKTSKSHKFRKSRNSYRHTLNSWSFYQLKEMIEYKAKLLGVPVVYVDPRYTSQMCSKCGLIGDRLKKDFKCPHCGHVDHADVNAAFNIALRSSAAGQSNTDRDVLEGSTDTPKMALVH